MAYWSAFEIWKPQKNPLIYWKSSQWQSNRLSSTTKTSFKWLMRNHIRPFWIWLKEPVSDTKSHPLKVKAKERKKRAKHLILSSLPAATHSICITRYSLLHSKSPFSYVTRQHIYFQEVFHKECFKEVVSTQYYVCKYYQSTVLVWRHPLRWNTSWHVLMTTHWMISHLKQTHSEWPRRFKTHSKTKLIVPFFHLHFE